MRSAFAGHACELVAVRLHELRPARESSAQRVAVGIEHGRHARRASLPAEDGVRVGRHSRWEAAAQDHGVRIAYQRVVRIEECAPLGAGDLGSWLPEAGRVPVRLVDDGERPAALARDRGERAAQAGGAELLPHGVAGVAPGEAAYEALETERLQHPRDVDTLAARALGDHRHAIGRVHTDFGDRVGDVEREVEGDGDDHDRAD